MKLRTIHESTNDTQASGLLMNLWLDKDITAALALSDIAEDMGLDRTADVLRYFYELEVAQDRHTEINARRLSTDQTSPEYKELAEQTKEAYRALRAIYDSERGTPGYQVAALRELEARHCYEPPRNKARDPGAVIATTQIGRCYRLTQSGYTSQAVTINIWPRIHWAEPMKISGRPKRESNIPVVACLLIAIRVVFTARNSKWR